MFFSWTNKHEHKLKFSKRIRSINIHENFVPLIQIEKNSTIIINHIQYFFVYTIISVGPI